MANRESQGLQIGLILCVMLVIGLGVTTYIFFSQSQDFEKQANDERALKDTAEKDRDAYIFAFELSKFTIGRSTKVDAELETARRSLQTNNKDLADEIDAIYKDFKADMAIFPADDSKRSYRDIPAYLLAALQKKNDGLTDADVREKTLSTEKDQAVSYERNLTQQAGMARDQAVAEKEAAKTKFDDDLKSTRDKWQTDAAQLAVKDKAFKELDDRTKKELEGLRKELGTNLETITNLKQRLAKYENQTYDYADGRITSVNQRENLVWVNLGFDDGLRRQMTFTVFSQAETNYTKENAKGSIEITRIISAHEAEARVLPGGEVTNPIVQNDVIFSLAWNPGDRLRFAIAGLIDINKDGQDDQEQFKNIIRINGGVIDAEIDPKTGQIVGPGVSIHTRYLVLGERPTEAAATNEVGQQILKSFAEMSSAADKFSIEKVTVDELLARMGWKGEARTVPLGKNANSQDFGPSSKAGEFRSRKPPSAY